MIELKDVSKYYNANGVTTIGLEHINLTFNKGDIIAITGESGSGKSTLLNVICANDTYDDGEIYFYGNETSYFDLNDQDNFRSEHVAFIYQNYNIIDSYTVLQNVMFPLLLKGYTKKEAKERALALISKVGLSARVNHRGTKLSGGEKQRVVIARALASDSEILACDEPTGNLDSQTAKEIINLIKEVATDKLVLIVTHNYEQVASIATRKVTLVDGHVIEDRVIEQIKSDEPQELVLKEQKVGFKNILFFTKNNILSTPKKTFFSFLVLFFMFFCILSMFQGLNISFAEAHINYAGNGYYGEDYVVFYKQNGSITKDDKAKLDALNWNINYYNYLTTQLIMPQGGGNRVRYMPYIPKYTNLYGQAPVADDECLLIVYASQFEYYADYLNQIIVFPGTNVKLKVTGLAEVSNVTSLMVCTKTNYCHQILSESFSNFDLNAYLGPNNEKIDIITNLVETNTSGKKCTLRLPYGYNYTDVTLAYNNFYFTCDYDIVYGDYQPGFYIDNIFNFDDIPLYEAGVYTDSPREVIKTLTEMGFNVYYPYDAITVPQGSYLTLFVLTLLCFIPACFIFLISYLIYKNIFASKFKEYTIMRIIGINKKSMSKMIILEIIMTTIFSALITFIFSLILGLGFGIKLYSIINSYISIIFIVLVLLFSIVLAFKTNNRLFAKTTAKMLKEGE